ncbi:MAG: AAA family ATPase [Ruminococcus sp.]|nr:AAA family ATPase [Ruminococcus sp.]
MSEYFDKYAAKENLCMAYIHKANEVREENDYMATKEEFDFLRQAMQLRRELVDDSVAEAKLYHTRKLRELTERVNEVYKQIDPEGYENILKRKKAAAAGAGTRTQKRNADASEVNGTSGSGRNSRDEISEETVKTWYAEKPKHSFKNVAGMAELKEKLIDCALSRQFNDLKEYLQMPIVHSYFFYGPPGCGKTYIIRAFANELMDKDYKYLYVDAAKIMSSLASIAEKKITRLFEEAKKNAPCILFIDEVDSVCRDRNQPSQADYITSMTASFLTAYNTLSECEKPVIFFGATNNPEKVDDAMLDRVELIYVDLPDAEARAHVLEMKVGMEGKVTLEEGFSFAEMGEKTVEFSYRDIDRLADNMKNLLLKAVTKEYKDGKTSIEKLKSGEYPLKKEIFEEALAMTVPTPKQDILDTMKAWRDKIDNKKKN